MKLAASVRPQLTSFNGAKLQTEPDFSVVVCCYNGARGLKSTLDCLQRQTIRDRIELIVVDDGSEPPIEEKDVSSRGATLIRHQENRGLSAARNTGIRVARAPIVAFTDDDCLPSPSWAQELLTAFSEPHVAGVGGQVVGMNQDVFLARYYSFNAPVRHLEANLGKSDSPIYRLWLYVLGNFKSTENDEARNAYSLVGANCSYRRSILEELGGFDAGIRFGGEDEDLCHRLRSKFPNQTLRIVPGAVVEHDYDLSIHDLVKRAKAYGEGDARNFLKHRNLSPTFFPAPVLWIFVLIGILARRRLTILVIFFPLLVAPRWIVSAVRSKSPERLSYAYVQMAQEGAHNYGFIKGLVKFRGLGSEACDREQTR